MPIDLYSSCPGGTGKKIKFCCSDFIGELHKIDRLLEGEQHLACLQHIDRLLEQGRPRACLLAIKGLVLRITGQFEAAAANAAAFLRHCPDNPVALAESAIIADAEDRLQDAMKILQLAMVASGQQVETRVYEAMGIVAEGMLEEGNWLAGRALLQMQMTLASGDREPVEKLVALNRSPGVPLIVKGADPLEPAPLGALGRQVGRGISTVSDHSLAGGGRPAGEAGRRTGRCPPRLAQSGYCARLAGRPSGGRRSVAEICRAGCPA